MTKPFGLLLGRAVRRRRRPLLDRHSPLRATGRFPDCWVHESDQTASSPCACERCVAVRQRGKDTHHDHLLAGAAYPASITRGTSGPHRLQVPDDRAAQPRPGWRRSRFRIPFRIGYKPIGCRRPWHLRKTFMEQVVGSLTLYHNRPGGLLRLQPWRSTRYSRVMPLAPSWVRHFLRMIQSRVPGKPRSG